MSVLGARLLRLLLTGCLLLTSLPMPAAEESPPLQVDATQIAFDELSPSWWSGYDKADPALKVRFLDKAQSELERELDRLSDPAQLSQGEVLLELIASLKKLSSLSFPVVPLPAPQQRYALADWLNLVLRQRELESHSLILADKLDASLSDLKTLKREIAQALLDYRNSERQSPQRIQLALEVVRRQLLLLTATEREAHLRREIATARGNLQQLRALREQAFATLYATPDSVTELEHRLSELAGRLVAVDTEVHKLRLATIRQEGMPIPLDLGVQVLGKESEQTRLLSEQLRLEIETNLQKMLTEASVQVPPDDPQRLAGLQRQSRSQRSELNRLLEQLSLKNGDVPESQLVALFKRAQSIREGLMKSDGVLLEAELLLQVQQRLLKAQQSWWERSTGELRQFGLSSLKMVAGWFSYPLFSISESPVTLLDLIRLLVIVSGAFLLSGHLRRLLKRLAKTQSTLTEASLFTVGRIVHYLIIIAALLIGLSTLGLDFTNLALVAGALSVGIGFGLQSIFNNFISGLILLFERPFKVGDLVALESGLRGRIRSINVRSTQLTTWDNIDILVPNSEFISGRVTNYTFFDDIRRLHVPFGVAYGSDKERVRQAAREAAAKVPYTLGKENYPTEVWLVNFGDSSLDFELIVWINHNRLPPGMNPNALYLWELESALRRHQIEIPFPQRDLHLRSAAAELIPASGPDRRPSPTTSGPDRPVA